MRENNDETLKDALQRFVNSKNVKPKVFQAKVSSLWPELMGPTIAGYTTEISLRRQVLYLRISSSSLRQELTYGKDKIVKLLNEELGEEYIRDVVIC